MVLSTLFAVSAIGIAVLIGSKAIEITRKKPVFILQIISRLDPVVVEKQKRALMLIQSKREKVLLVLTEELPRQTRYFFLAIKMQAKKRYEDMVLNVRGVRTFNTTREASPFLRDIREYKEKNGGGVIVDEIAVGVEEKDENSVL